MKKYCVSKSGSIVIPKSDGNSGHWPFLWIKKCAAIAAILLLLAGTTPATPQAGRIRIFAQTGGACGTGIAHCTVLSWGASTTSGVTYSVYRGTATGGESATPQNASQITGLTYIDPVTLTSSPQTFFYYIEAVETSSGIVVNSAPSNEVSVTFPGIPASPSGTTATPH